MAPFRQMKGLLMKKLTFLLVAACAALSLLARVEPGENIVHNGTLDSDRSPLPLGWLLTGNDAADCTCDPNGYLGAMPSVKFSNPGPEPKSLTLRQGGITLVPGAKYRISAKIRTKGLKTRNAGVVAISCGWAADTGVVVVKPDQDWTECSREVAMVPSRLTGEYALAIYASKYTGEIEFADIRFEAVSPEALAGTLATPNSGDPRLPRLVPVRPLLARIPRDRRAITFRFYGVLPEKTAPGDCDIVLSTFDAEGVTRTHLAEETSVALPAGAQDGRMEVRIVRRADGKELLKDDYRFAVVDRPAVVATAGRRLNNLVTELVAAPVGSDEETFEFALAEPAWVFMSLQKPGAGADLDGTEVIGPRSLNGETFRWTEAGRHVVRARNGKDARLVVRRVAETLNYTSFAQPFVRQNGPYGWDFCEKYVFPATTTQNGGGGLTAEQMALRRERGGLWLSNLNVTSITNGDDLVARLRRPFGNRNSNFDGLTCDEMFFDKPGKLADYTAGLKSFNAAYKGDRLLYTWVNSKPFSRGVDHEFLSACANASRGRGRILCETYCVTKPTEREALEYFADYMTDTMRRVAALYPGAGKSVGLVLGNYTQVPICSVWHHPEVDYKYFLDLQFRLLANDPAFRDLAITGVWGSYYADREIHRWTMALLRHYCVEGNTALLSERLGYRYLPGHVANGDFASGLDGWAVSGTAAADSSKDLAYPVEGRRYHAAGQGDTFAKLVKRPGETTALVQTAKGLVPGRFYCLRACLFDAKDLHAKRGAPRRVELDLAFGDSAVVEKDLTWRFIAKPRPERPREGAFVNYEQVVFRATAPEVEFRISNAAAPDGSELGVNYISLCPFFAE